MNAIILAAGRGSRLQKLTSDKPKCLNEVGRYPMLEWQIAALKAGGVTNIYVVTGYKASLLKDFDAKTIHNPVWETTNMVESLLCASHLFNQPTVVSYSDIIYNRSVVEQLLMQTRDVTVVYDTNWLSLWRERFSDPLDDAESFRINSKDQIVEIGQEVDSLEDVMGQYTGLMKFSPVAFEWVEQFIRNKEYFNKMDMTTLLNGLICSGHSIYGMAIHGGWCEIDTASDLKIANELHDSNRLIFSSGV